MGEWFDQHGASPELRDQAFKVLELDQAFCPRVGPSHDITRTFAFGFPRTVRSRIR